MLRLTTALLPLLTSTAQAQVRIPPLPHAPAAPLSSPLVFPAPSLTRPPGPAPFSLPQLSLPQLSMPRLDLTRPVEGSPVLTSAWSAPLTSPKRRTRAPRAGHAVMTAELPSYLSVADEGHRAWLSSIYAECMRLRTARRILSRIEALAETRGMPVEIELASMRGNREEFVFDQRLVRT